jgi:preprotein translocase subunit SecA
MIKALGKILGLSPDRNLKKLQPVVDRVNEIESEFQTLSDTQLRSKTEHFKSRLQSGESLDDLLPESFATVREAAKRALGQRHFDVQLMGGIVLHQGKISEMRTGEGKTLVATLSAYLNALEDKGVHVVTVNDYLARRDAQWMGSIYNLLGLTTGTLQHDSAFIYEPSNNSSGDRIGKQTPVPRNQAYQANITYGTNNEFGFDYLRDNMAIDISHRVQKNLSYAIVDEVDNILIDEARTPLIISGPAEESGKEYLRFARVVPGFRDQEDYTIDQKHRSVSLTPEGVAKIEKMLKVDNLYSAENIRLVHFVENALRAKALFEKDKEYVVRNGEVLIVDEFTGRLMPGRRFSDGLHQALEAKEAVAIQRETITYATITLQNYFRLYSKLSGMTGTAITEAEEFFKIYKLDVQEIPTNVPMIRNDKTDLIYKNQNSKFNAVVNHVKERHDLGQPVLVGTTDISKSELISEKLKRRGIPHEVLNAKQHEHEASTVAQAGRLGAVTVATNMAGRGTDIVLGGNPETLEMPTDQWQSEHGKVVSLGGLYIIGTERHEARRIDNQLRGRSGRQGDPGTSQFFVALDDGLMKRFGGERIKSVMEWAGVEDDIPLENNMLSKTLEGAQVKVEAYNFDIRKHLVEYDDVVNTHRNIIYEERDKILEGSNLRSNVQSLVSKELSYTVSKYITGIPPEDWDTENLVNELNSILPLIDDNPQIRDIDRMDEDEIEKTIHEIATDMYEMQETNVTPELMRTIERQVMLRFIDSNWVPHLTTMENLRQGIGLYAYGQRDPLVMYKKEGRDKFEALLERIQYDIVHSIYNVTGNQLSRGKSPVANQKSSIRNSGTVTQSQQESGMDQSSSSTSHKVGRNDPCPCGSTKKYKRCHGI